MIQKNPIVNEIGAVLFDMDGVLLDSEPLHDIVVSEVCRKFGRDVDRSELGQYVGTSSLEMWTEMRLDFDIDADVDTLVNMQWETIIEMLDTSGIGPSVGLIELMEELYERGVYMAIASSSREDFIEAVMDHLGIRKYISEVTQGFEVEHGKPEPDIYLLAAKKAGVLPANCLVIEDSTAGVGAGVAAGMYTIGYDNPTSNGQDIAKADMIVDSLTEIMDIVRPHLRPGQLADD